MKQTGRGNFTKTLQPFVPGSPPTEENMGGLMVSMVTGKAGARGGGGGGMPASSDSWDRYTGACWELRSYLTLRCDAPSSC